MNMWVGGRAYGYSRFKKSVPTENMGVGGAACPGHGSAPCADVVITINNRNSSKQNEVIFRWSAPLASAAAVCPLAVCKPCGNEARYRLEHVAGSDSSSLPL